MKPSTGVPASVPRDQPCEGEAPVGRELTRRPGGSENEASISSLGMQALTSAGDSRRRKGSEETADEPEAGGDPRDRTDTAAEERETGDVEEEVSLEDRQHLLAVLRKVLLLPKVVTSSADLAPLEERAGGSAEAAGTGAPHLGRHRNEDEHEAREEETDEEKEEEHGEGKEGEAGAAEALSGEEQEKMERPSGQEGKREEAKRDAEREELPVFSSSSGLSCSETADEREEFSSALEAELCFLWDSAADRAHASVLFSYKCPSLLILVVQHLIPLLHQETQKAKESSSLSPASPSSASSHSSSSAAAHSSSDTARAGCGVPLSRLGEILVGVLGNLFSHSSLFNAHLLESIQRKADRPETPASSASSPSSCRELFECLVELLLLSEDTRILKETLRAFTAILFSLSRMPHRVLSSLLSRAHEERNEPQDPQSSSSSSSFSASSPVENAVRRPTTSAESDDACAAEAVLSKCLFVLRHALSPDLTAAVATFLSQLFTFLLSYPFPSSLSSSSSSSLSCSFSRLLFPSPSAFLRAIRTPAFLSLPASSSLSSEAAAEASMLVLGLQKCQEFFGGSFTLLPPSRLACLLSQVGSRAPDELEGDEVLSLSAVSRELFQCSLYTPRASTGEQGLKEEDEEGEEEDEDVEEPENVRGLVDLLLLLDASVVLLEATARETGEVTGAEGSSGSANANSEALETLLSYSLQVCGKALLSAAQDTSLVRVSLLLLLRVASEAPLRRRVEAYVHLMMCTRKGEGVLEKLLLLREEDDLVEDADPLLGILFVAQFAPRHLQKEAKNELLSVVHTHVAAQPAARGVRTPQRGGVGAEERDRVEHEVEGASFQMSDFLDASFLEFLLSVIDDSP